MRPIIGELVEAKTAQNELDWGEEGTDQIPIYYRTQVIWNMSVLGAKRCWVPVLIRGCKYVEYCVEWDEAAQTDAEILIAAGQSFIDSLVNDQAPPIDGHDETYRVLRERHPDIEPGDVEIDQPLRDAFLEATVAKAEIKEIWNLAASEILAALGKTRNAVDSNFDMFAYRKPNGDHPPYLCPNPAIVKSLRPARVISWGDHLAGTQRMAEQAKGRLS
jgi:predicted phage-related endonuclease